MRKPFAVLRALLACVSLAALQVGCGSSDAGSPSSVAGAPGSAGSPSSAGTGGASAGAASAGAPSAGAGGTAVGSGGSAGSTAGANSGGAPAAGAAGMAPFGAITCNPIAGPTDGKHDLTTTQDPPEWTLQNGAVAGKLTAKASFVSASYTPGHFSYWVYTSANYVMGSPAVFLLFGDGNQFLKDFHAATVLDNLTSSHDLPPTVALFVDPPSDGVSDPKEGDRQQAYDPPTDKYTTLLFNELLPSVIFGKYTISRDPNAWAEVGYSASGGQGWKVLWNRPNDIHKFIGISSSFGAANVAPYLVDWVSVVSMAPARPLRVSLLASTKDLVDQRGNWQTINTNMANALAAKGDQWRLIIAQAACTEYATCGHYPPIDGERDFPNALRWTFQGCKF